MDHIIEMGAYHIYIYNIEYIYSIYIYIIFLSINIVYTCSNNRQPYPGRSFSQGTTSPVFLSKCQDKAMPQRHAWRPTWLVVGTASAFSGNHRDQGSSQMLWLFGVVASCCCWWWLLLLLLLLLLLFSDFDSERGKIWPPLENKFKTSIAVLLRSQEISELPDTY